MVKLVDIKDLVQKIAEAISGVLDMDVIISDSAFNKIADTKKHFNLEVTEIKDTYVLGKVINSGTHSVVYGKSAEEQCRKCIEQAECNLEAMICIPILLKQEVIGAIALIAIDETSKRHLVNNQLNLIQYMNRMAELIVGKVLEQEASNRLKIVKNQMVHIINSIDEGIITLDEFGAVIYVNSVIKDYFGIDERFFAEEDIESLFSQAYMTQLIKNHKPFSNIEAEIKWNDRDFSGLVSGKPMKLDGKHTGAILTFRNMKDVYSVINKVSLNTFSISFDIIVGKSKAIEDVKETAKRVANSHSTVLILGESGTGKELFARAIHFSSDRRDKPFITLNCAAIPESLLESELFGYEEGSFTGAVKGGKPGKFQLADGGSIFLDEIGDMPLHLQTKLLRVLQEKSVEKIGSVKSIPLDVRVIAATNKNLEEMVENRAFREDLYYRLSVIPLKIPSLRERIGDVDILLDYFLNQYNHKLNKRIQGFQPDVRQCLLAYQWPGNVRELENVVEYAVNIEDTTYVTQESIPDKIKEKYKNNDTHFKVQTLQNVEKALILNTLQHFSDSYEGKLKVAKALGISPATLYRKLKKYSIE